jgi:hypothetical protein
MKDAVNVELDGIQRSHLFYLDGDEAVCGLDNCMGSVSGVNGDD